MGRTDICSRLSVAGTLEQPSTAPHGTAPNGGGESIRNQNIQEAEKRGNSWLVLKHV